MLYSGVVGLLSYLCVLDHRYFKAHGSVDDYGSEEVKGEGVV